MITECPICNGRGKIGRDECAECGGTGAKVFCDICGNEILDNFDVNDKHHYCEKCEERNYTMTP